MSKKPPNRPGITFEVGARIEAQDYLQKWYSSRIEEIDYDEGKMLVHFDRWSHRYDEWIAWDSTRLRSLERPSLRKEGLKEEEGEMTERLSEMSASRLDELPGCTESTEDQTELPQPRQELRDGEEVLARWTDCRYYPAKIESVNKEGTYTVQFYDGVIRCVKRIHIKSMPDDAKGQDWIALVKAASAAANSKGNNKPRTSANSNKERDEAPRGRSDDEEDADEESSRKRSRQEISLRNHKRARASKTTGKPSNNVMNTKRSEDPTSPSDLDHYKCKILGCAKAFRKAKLLDYHLKYYHNADKDLQDSEPTVSPDRGGRTRATSASMPNTTHLEVPDSAKRRRTVSTSSSMSPQTHVFQLDCAGPPRFNRKKRSSASISSDSTELSLPPPSRDFEALHDKILKKVIDKDKHLEPGNGQCSSRTEPKKDKDKERRDRKDKDPFKIKQKKKKKKKKSKQHCYSDYDNVTLSFLERSQSSPLHRASAFTFLPSSSATSSSQRYQYPRAILSVDLTGENLSDIDFLEDSTTESLLLSGDEYNQEFDSLTMEDFQEEDDGSQEIVRCICEMDEENGFMIQCEECMCWQHSVCMGLLEDSIPDQYICYICRDPPGQRWSAKYLHDREWLNKGHMYGLSFVTENYSQQNSEKIVSTHQLLADVFSVNKILNGLQLKMDILQNKHNPNLHFWARSWVNSDEDQPMGGLPDCIRFTDHLDDVSLDNHNSSNPDTYITSEHRYWLIHSCLLLLWKHKTRQITFTPMEEEVRSLTALAVSGCLNESGPDAVEHARNCLQWQMNLLTHIEDVQNQVAGRMDLIEKELDVLESWLDFTGELEPPDPLARLPQLKHRIKQLLTDLSKVQQMSALCSV
uniref:C2H2-type domain-containing protein n=1 Tax=Esox lucius TaxID=8010 RepID=A0A6Q2XXA9_ESOLU